MGSDVQPKQTRQWQLHHIDGLIMGRRPRLRRDDGADLALFFTARNNPGYAGFRLEKSRLTQREKRLDNLEHGKHAALSQRLGDLPVCGSRQCDFLWEPCAGSDELLDDSPTLVEDLHERAIVWNGANNEIAAIIPNDAVAGALVRGDDPQAQASRRFEILRVDLD